MKFSLLTMMIRLGRSAGSLRSSAHAARPSRPMPFWPVALATSLLISFGLTAPCTWADPAPAPTVQVSNRDVDNDGRDDAEIETNLYRLAVSSRDGRLIYYYLKGQNFNENMYPPALLDAGYTIASSALQSLGVVFGGYSRGAKDFDLTVERPADGRAVVVAMTLIKGGEDGGEPIMGITKRYEFYADRYAFDVTAIVSNLATTKITVGGPAAHGLELLFGPGIFLDKVNPATLVGLQPTSHLAYDTPEALLAAATPANAFTGIGLKTQYFCCLLDARRPAKLLAQRMEILGTGDRKKTFAGDVIGLAFPPFDLAPQQAESFSFQIYLGPKTLDGLQAISREAITDYGFLSTVLLRVLQFFYALIPNYGVAIVLLTLFVRVMLYPLTLKQTKSMAQIQKIQPLVQDLKDRYKDDTQKFNEEVLKLYQKHNVNPIGGCLPLLLQLPILIALYNTINIAVELRKTSFLWIPDLSLPDPLILLPIGISALMYYQQGKMTDPQQQQMMAFMPLFMFVITWSLPAGLLVYWFTSTILGLLQQIQANKLTLAAKEE